MSQAPYSPLHAPRKEVSQERMAEILSRHAKPNSVSSQPNSATESAESDRAAALEWLKPESKYCVRSKCGRYSVAKVFCGTIASYEIWRLVPVAQIAVGLGSFEEAKKVAQADLQKRQK